MTGSRPSSSDELVARGWSLLLLKRLAFADHFDAVCWRTSVTAFGRLDAVLDCQGFCSVLGFDELLLASQVSVSELFCTVRRVLSSEMSFEDSEEDHEQFASAGSECGHLGFSFGD